MYAFSVKSCKECHKDRKGIKKVVTFSLVDLPSSFGHLINYVLTEFAFRTVRY